MILVKGEDTSDPSLPLAPGRYLYVALVKNEMRVDRAVEVLSSD